MWSWQRAQLSVMPKKALDVCSTVASSHTLRLKRYQLRTRKPLARSGVGIAGRDLVGRQHFADHLVVGLVGIERLDDPIAPPPDVRLALAHLGPIAVPIAIAPHVHPVPAPALAILRAGQQPIDHALISVVGRIGHERTQLGGRRRQTDQIQIHAPQAARSWPPARSGVRPCALVLGGQKTIDRMRGPVAAFCTSGSGGRAGF